MTKQRLSYKAVIFASLVSGIISSFIAVLILFILTASTGEGFELYTPLSLTITCIFSSFVAGNFYYGIAEYLKNYRTIYIILTSVTGLLSVLPSLFSPLYSGSYSLFVIALHLSVCSSITVLIPLLTGMVVKTEESSSI